MQAKTDGARLKVTLSSIVKLECSSLGEKVIK
jgi:hypothetical protein